MVEGTDCPTIASSLDDEVCDTLVAGLKKKDSSQNQQIKTKVLDCNQLATYLSLVVWEELRRFLATDRAPLECPV